MIAMGLNIFYGGKKGLLDVREGRLELWISYDILMECLSR